MAQSTKLMLFDSFKAQLKDKPFSKITITDITDGVGVNRHTFYYHFKDLNGLMTWGFDTTLGRILADCKDYETLALGLKALLDYAVDEKKFILTIYHSDLREHLERLIVDWTGKLVKRIVESGCREMRVREADVQFVIDFYKFGISGLLIDWLAGGMMDGPEKTAAQIATLVSGDFKDILEKFNLDRQEN